ncbi:MAG: hypothetical protein IJC95_06250 [Clostridia bacterium]|nr:hypothetical protein [Clostridia bacterium]MBQ3057068.1 hypothetical protein [Clostridia bacterium]
MKKSVVILITIIYIASIALVSFFGLQFKVFDEIVYSNKIELLNEDIKIKNGEPYALAEKGEDGVWRYQLKYRVYPDNVTNSAVTFSYDNQNNTVSIDENGVVTITKKGPVIIQILPQDGSPDVSATLTVWAREKN